MLNSVFLLGALAKLGATVATYPLLVVKSQNLDPSCFPSKKANSQGHPRIPNNTMGNSSTLISTKEEYKDFIEKAPSFVGNHTMTSSVSTDKGTPTTILLKVTHLSIFRGGYGIKLRKDSLKDESPHHLSFKNFTLFPNPISRLQAKQEIGGNISLRYSGTFDAIIKMIRYEGLPGFYKGMSTKIVQSVFAASVLFMVKEELVKAYLVLADKSRKVLQK
ncbi:Peroxisomal nicotinamide adenine dinucleotide carrier [Vitis vinifera]|uniref:Peroxisomal nicotinamide adenine dinucleotide carrier n=1 Tax=Vitis vinifera TaxID=29760 RepID=A0A438ETM2_VITVI|nr:Peroxisomal nicotinamide adenine dinucleotide carrier [Vitis vinifera]